MSAAGRWRERLLVHLTPGRVLALVLMSFALLASTVLALTPPYEANDEFDHIQNVETLAMGHWYRIGPKTGFEPHQPPLYYLVLAAYQRLMGASARQPDGQILIGHGPEHGIFEHNVAHDGDDQRRVDLLRLPSVLFGLLAIALTYLAARQVSRDRWTPVVAAALVAGVPKFVFLSGVVNNDNLSDTLGAAGLACTLWLVASPPPSRRWRALGAGAVGLLAGAAVLTKTPAGLIAPGLLVGVLLAAPNRREAIQLGALFVLAAFVVCGWWFVQNQVRYGDPLAATATREHFKVFFPALLEVPEPLRRIVDDIPRRLYSSFWYDSGWNQFSWRWFWYLPFWGLAGLGLGALLWRGRRPRPGGKRSLWVCWLVALGALASFWVLGLETATEEARVAFVGLPAIATLIALGYERLRLPVALRFLLPAIGLIGALAAIRYNVLIPYI